MSTIIHPRYNLEWTVYENANFSTAKQKYSFPKSCRFKSKNNAQNESCGYDLPSTRQVRATTFGFGDRSNANSKKNGKFK